MSRENKDSPTKFNLRSTVKLWRKRLDEALANARQSPIGARYSVVAAAVIVIGLRTGAELCGVIPVMERPADELTTQKM